MKKKRKKEDKTIAHCKKKRKKSEQRFAVSLFLFLNFGVGSHRE